jgi:hypothetical protein
MRGSRKIERVDKVGRQEDKEEGGSIEVRSRGIGKVRRSRVGRVRRGMVGDDGEVRIDMIIHRGVGVVVMVVMVVMGGEENRLDATLTIGNVIGIEGMSVDGRGGWTIRHRRGTSGRWE